MLASDISLISIVDIRLINNNNILYYDERFQVSSLIVIYWNPIYYIVKRRKNDLVYYIGIVFYINKDNI